MHDTDVISRLIQERSRRDVEHGTLVKVGSKDDPKDVAFLIEQKLKNSGVAVVQFIGAPACWSGMLAAVNAATVLSRQRKVTFSFLPERVEVLGKPRTPKDVPFPAAMKDGGDLIPGTVLSLGKDNAANFVTNAGVVHTVQLNDLLVRLVALRLTVTLNKEESV